MRNIIFKFLFVLIFLQFTSFAQTEEQKEMMYKHINSTSSATYVSIFPKTKPIASKEILFSEAIIFPVYKIVFNELNKPNLIQNKNYFIVLFNGKLYQFADEFKSESSKVEYITKTISKLNEQKKDFKIVYFTESFSTDFKYLKPLIFDSEIHTITEKDKTYKLSEFINYKYGSIDKIKEIVALEKLRDNLNMTDYYSFMKTNYGLFNYYCPKDTTLVVNTLIKQVKLATKGFTTGQETSLLNRVKLKINPYESLKKDKTSSDSGIAFLKTKEEEYKKGMLNVSGFYEYKIYDVSITNELMEILTNEQFNDYKKYIDLWKPSVETALSLYNNKYRYTYGIEIVNKEGIKYKHYSCFTDKILEDCGCPYDETVEERKKRIILVK